jgi:hypothetical protein
MVAPSIIRHRDGAIVSGVCSMIGQAKADRPRVKEDAQSRRVRNVAAPLERAVNTGMWFGSQDAQPSPAPHCETTDMRNSELFTVAKKSRQSSSR